MAGRFITLEGGEGVGKSTQVPRLAKAIRARGHDVVVTREPGGSEGAEAIRKLLLEGDTGRWSARTEALLFAAARADHVEKTIRPALEAERWVLCDRFLDSSLAYQAEAGGVGTHELMELHRIGSGGLLPDRTLVLALPVFDAAFREFARDQGKLDRFGRKSGPYHDRVASAFAALPEEHPERVRSVNAEGEIGEVTDRLMAALEDFL